MLKRLAYLGYYIKKMDWEKFRLFFNHVRKETKKPSIYILFDIVKSSLKYNISILEYFQFRFYNLSSSERMRFAGTGVYV